MDEREMQLLDERQRSGEDLDPIDVRRLREWRNAREREGIRDAGRSGRTEAGAAFRSEDARRNHNVRDRDPLGLGARYLDAVGDPAYKTAFGKILQDPTHGHLRFSAREREAFDRVNQVMF